MRIQLLALGILVSLSAQAVYSAHPEDVRHFSIYKPNYFIFMSDRESYIEDGKDTIEVKFQISFKTDLITSVKGIPVNLYFGYTQKSFWELFQDSSPFKELNFNPEFFFRWEKSDLEKLYFLRHLNILKLEKFQIGYEHLSNGVGGDDSRRWDRIATEIQWKKEGSSLNTSLYLRGWVPIRKDSSNGDIEDYSSWGHLIATASSPGNQWRLGAEWKPSSKYIMNIIIEPAFRFWQEWQGFFIYCQFWHGYAEGLRDYNKKYTRIGIGFSLIKN
jgi:phospholipase A1